MLTSREDRFANYQKAQKDSNPGQMSTYGVMQREPAQDSKKERAYTSPTRHMSKESYGRMDDPNMRDDGRMSLQRASIDRYMGGYDPAMPQEQSESEPQITLYSPMRQRMRAPQQSNRMMMYQGTPEDFINSR